MFLKGNECLSKRLIQSYFLNYLLQHKVTRIIIIFILLCSWATWPPHKIAPGQLLKHGFKHKG